MKGFDTLKTMANNKSSWRERIEAIEWLKEYDTQQAKDVIMRLAINDPVFKVKEAAFRLAQSRGYQSNGKPVFLGKKSRGNLVKGIDKILANVQKELPEEYSLEDFKKMFQKKYPVEYDLYDGDKEERFDKWLENIIKSLPKK